MVVKDWGFEYLKLDFLYSAVLGARDGTLMDKGKTGAQAMAAAMDLIRQILREVQEGRKEGGKEGGKGDRDMREDVTILGCGAALGSTIGKVHINRISADAGLTWFPSLGPIPVSDKWNLPSASNMVRENLTLTSITLSYFPI